MIGGKRKKGSASPAVEYSAERFLKGFEGMTNKEIKETIYLVDEGIKFEEAVNQVKARRKE
jgi:hypothetical protein